MPGDLIDLGAIIGRSRMAACGCELAEVAPRTITREGRYEIGREVVLIPCSYRDEAGHVPIMAAAITAVGGHDDLDAAIKRFEEEL